MFEATEGAHTEVHDLEQIVQALLALRPARVLEIGCGSGQLLIRVAPACEEYIGTDSSASMLRWLSRLDLPRGVSLRHKDPSDFSGMPEAYFDAVVLTPGLRVGSADEMLRIFGSAVRCLRPGGALFVRAGLITTF